MQEGPVTHSHGMIVDTPQGDTSTVWSGSVNEERILNKLDSIEGQSTAMLVALGKLEEQIKEVPDLKVRLRALEQWRWMIVGALVAGGGSFATQLASLMKGVQ